MKIELISSKNPWGLFTEEEVPRIILSTWLTQDGQAIEVDEDNLTPNQMQVVETSYCQGIIKVTDASFLRKTVRKQTVNIFDAGELEDKDTDFQKMMKAKAERVKAAQEKKKDPTIDRDAVVNFLKKRQDKVIVAIKKNEKPVSFLKECRKVELERKRPRKKVMEALEEVIELRIASIQKDAGGMKNPNKFDPHSMIGGQSMLEKEYSDLLTEEELTEPEEVKQYTKEEIDALIKKFKNNS